MSKPFVTDVIELTPGGPQILQGTADPRVTPPPVNPPITSMYLRKTTGDWFYHLSAGATDWLPMHADGAVGMFGDGSIGDLVVAGATNEASAVGDVYYNNLTISAGGVYKPQGRRIYVFDTLTIDVGGSFNLNGNNAAAAVGGLATTGYITAAGTAGGTGTTGAGGAGTNSASIAIPNGTGTSVGGAGGLGTSGAGGAAGTQGANGAFGSVRDPDLGLTGFSQGASQAGLAPGTGGGGGGGNGAQNGGGGGGGAGSIIIRARKVINNGTLSAIGGNGANGLAADCGGGGGGGGGRVIVMARSYVGAAGVVTGGNQGASGGGGGAGGTAGAAGFFIFLPVV